MGGMIFKKTRYGEYVNLSMAQNLFVKENNGKFYIVAWYENRSTYLADFNTRDEAQIELDKLMKENNGQEDD